MKLSRAQKFRALAGLVLVFLLVLATNMMDNQHFATVQRSITSVYEDRLLAKNYLYNIARHTEKKRYALTKNEIEESLKTINTSNDSIRIFVEAYANTKLTSKESQYFESFQENMRRLEKRETDILDGLLLNEEEDRGLESLYTAVMNDLNELSKIQVKEGERELGISNRAIKTSYLISKIEMVVLILIGVIIQLLIFVKPLKSSSE